MKNSKVSVIIPTYNEQENIDACLKTILDQSFNNFEVIIVDDGSNDRTVELVESYPVKLIKSSHQGPAKARNLGVEKSEGGILIFVDADMTFDKDFIKELTEPINQEKFKGTFSKREMVANWDNLWSRCWNFNKGIKTSRMIPEDYPDEGIDFRAILKSEFTKVNGFDDVGYTDTWSLFKKLGFRPHTVNGATYFHNNPDSLNEVFKQSKWVAKREYKFGLLGVVIALIRFSLPVSLLVGIKKSIEFREPRFLIFKIVCDLGSFKGLLEKIFLKNLTK